MSNISFICKVCFLFRKKTLFAVISSQKKNISLYCDFIFKDVFGLESEFERMENLKKK